MWKILPLEYPLFLLGFNKAWIFATDFRGEKKKTQISSFINIRPVGALLFHADGQTDMKLIVAFRNFANAPKKKTGGFLRFRSQEGRQLLRYIGNILPFRYHATPKKTLIFKTENIN
jgi:hypothetical protein